MTEISEKENPAEKVIREEWEQGAWDVIESAIPEEEDEQDQVDRGDFERFARNVLKRYEEQRVQNFSKIEHGSISEDERRISKPAPAKDWVELFGKSDVAFRCIGCEKHKQYGQGYTILSSGWLLCHDCRIELVESERRIGKNELRVQLKEKIEKKRSELSKQYEDFTQCTDEDLAGYSGEQQFLEWVLKVLDDAEENPK